jgi:hypothetical protein
MASKEAGLPWTFACTQGPLWLRIRVHTSQLIPVRWEFWNFFYFSRQILMRIKHQAKKKKILTKGYLIYFLIILLCYATTQIILLIIFLISIIFPIKLFIYWIYIYQILVFLISLLLYNHDKTRLRRHAMTFFNQNLKNTILLCNFD